MTINTINVTWQARRESAEQCAARLRKFFIKLAQEFPLLADWYERGESRAAASVGPAVNQFDENQLISLVSNGASKRDIGDGIFPEQGFRVGLWNQGKPGVDASLSVKCGSYHERLSNVVVIELPSDLNKVGIDSDEAQEQLLLLMANAWDADWGAVFATNCEALKARRQSKGTGPFLDKMLWMKKAQSESPFDESVAVKKLDSGVLYSR